VKYLWDNGGIMITKEELLEQATQFELNQSDIQRDYVFGWLISGIFQASRLSDQIVLKGGNALRKGYFPGTRFSDDLDFTTEQGLDGDYLIAQLNQVCRFAEASTGVRFDLDRNRITDEHQIDRQKKVYKIKLYFKDLIAGKDHITLSVRMDVTEYDRLYLPVQTRPLIHPYSDADQCATDIRVVKLEEALADKLKCLLQRRYCYDLFDLVYGAFMSRDIEVNRAELMQVFLRKTIFGHSPGAARNLLLDLPVDLFRGYWGKVIVPAATRFSFDEAVEMLKSGVQSLFDESGHGIGAMHAFYPSHLRNPILEAGSGLNLMRLTYDGVTRTVEPYSLSFKRRQDGQANEYLYVWDRVGGHSGPGIKALFHHKIRNLEILENTFEPRFTVELAKAGDSSQSGYFSGSPGPRRTTSRSGTRVRRITTGPVYIIGCTACGKEFKRTKASTRLNKHKNMYGMSCYGGAGFIKRMG